MVWNSLSPDGTKSVKQNTTPMLQNTAYTESTMNTDHYWNIGTDEDGHHKSIQMKNFINSSVGAPADAPIATGMDACVYLRTVSASDARIQGFFRNTNGIYQFIPAFKSGSVAITSSYATVAAVPAHSYGQIFMFLDNNDDNMSMGFFKSGAATVQTYASTTQFSGSSTAGTNLKFGNGAEASGLNIRARKQDGSNGTYLYRIVYWGI